MYAIRSYYAKLTKQCFEDFVGSTAIVLHKATGRFASMDAQCIIVEQLIEDFSQCTNIVNRKTPTRLSQANGFVKLEISYNFV